MLQSSLQNLRTFLPEYHLANNLRLAYDGLSDLSNLPAIKANNPEAFHAKAGSLCYSFLESQGEVPQRTWLAVFVYEKGWAMYDWKTWHYAIFA